MTFKTIFGFIIACGLGGVALSGYLSWYTLWGPGCTETIVSCGGPEPILIFGLPTCVYGFFMFLLTAILGILGILEKNKRTLLRVLLVVTIIGVGFSAFLSYYELFLQDVPVDELPACVYGLVLYIGALIFTIVGLRKHVELVRTDNV